MKRHKARLMIAAGAMMMVAAAVTLAGPPNWRFRVDVFDAAGTNEVQMLASTGGEVAWVRWNNVGGTTNTAASAVKMISAADGWVTTMGSYMPSNAVATQAVSKAAAIVQCTNVQWRVGDKLRIESQRINAGTLAVGYWYYE